MDLQFQRRHRPRWRAEASGWVARSADRAFRRASAAGWTGKLWAVSQGVERAMSDSPKYLWLTDADIGHDAGNLKGLVARAEAGDLALTSLMVELHCRTWPERFLIPAFVYFFQMVYPFAKVNRPGRTAGAAGGCMLARADALAAAGGIAAIRKALIDDCALGALMKRKGPIWLGLTHRARSLRPYATLGQIGRMVSRSAYAQLDYSPLKLVGVIAGMALVYVAPLTAVLFGQGALRVLGLSTWAIMALSFQPMLQFYRLCPLWGLALPPSARPTRFSLYNRRCNSGAARAAFGRAAPRPWHDDEHRHPTGPGLGQGLERRELPRRLLADRPQASARGDGVLPFRAHR